MKTMNVWLAFLISVLLAVFIPVVGLLLVIAYWIWRLSTNKKELSLQEFQDLKAKANRESAAVTQQLRTQHQNNGAQKTSTEIATDWHDDGSYSFEVVGESNYQRALKRLAGEHDQYGAKLHCIAKLIPDDDNPHDNKAVRVEIDRETIGHLSRDDARSFRRRLGHKKLSGKTTTCPAKIVGGGIRDGKRLSYGVWLDMKPFNN